MNHKIHNPHNVSLDGVKITGDGTIHIGQGAEIRYGTVIELGSGLLKIGKNSVIGFNSFLQITGEITIGAGSLLGPQCCYIASKHKIIPGKNIIGIPLVRGKITIGDNVWIGANCTINCGVQIQDSSIIGANSFVNSTIETGKVYGGSPAKYLKDVKDMK